MSMFDLTGKVAVITGSSRGIGRAAAVSMAEQGARVVVSSRNQADCDAAAEAINAVHPGHAIAVACDITQPADQQHLMDRAREAFGPIDILVCNAAAGGTSVLLTQITAEQLHTDLDVNLVANVGLIQKAVPDMIAREDGAVIIVSSIGGHSGGSALAGGYSMAKAAETQLARTLAVELGPKNIRVNCVAPGLTRTELARGAWEDPARQAQMLSRTPIKRVAEPEDVAGAIVFLATRAGAFMTGETLIVDGGKTMA
ncbi:SDR family NAD(P)-dependent oxidoreductase [Phenylobacterium sp.]|uniref:SDR family NAD(P)-dependent oxidoreductase n=1 Tax=Phenylobacterium sp. TaxID=1871053 RepID=UPI002735E5E5|nr:glucose 1-dehydrogenase [Phenylobacterium sp.]MDP3659428.1 glucose 1-dehydrogenase [Phenylobacterium sp.]